MAHSSYFGIVDASANRIPARAYLSPCEGASYDQFRSNLTGPRVNLEQASKGQSWKPTRPIFGEGRSGIGKQPSNAPISIHRGNEDSMSGR